MKNYLPIVLIFLLSKIAYGEIVSNNISLDIINEKSWIEDYNKSINSWLYNEDLGFNIRFKRLDSLQSLSLSRYGKLSISNSYFIHKKGVLYHWRGLLGDISKYDSAIFYYSSALKIRLGIFPVDNYLFNEIVNGYGMIGICYSLIGDVSNSINYVLKGLNLLDTIEVFNDNFNNFFYLNTQAARSYSEMGDYDQVISHYNAVINYSSQKNSQTALEWKARAYIELGGLHANELYNPQHALELLAEGERILGSCLNTENINLMASLLNKKGIAFYRSLNFDSAKQCYTKAISHFQILGNTESVINNWINMGLLFHKSSNYDSASYYLLKAKDQQNISSKMLSSIYENLGDLAYKKGRYIESINYYNDAISTLISSYSPKSILSNPEIFTNTIISDKIRLLNSLALKGNALLQFHLKSNAKEYLNSAYWDLTIADQVIGMMRSGFQAEASRMSLASYAKPIYELGIEACYMLYQMQPNDSLLNKAFEFAEKSKAIVLLDAVRKTNARAHVDPKLIEAEKSMNLKVNYFEKQAALYEQDTTMTYSYGVYDSLLYYRRQRQKVVDQIKETTPEYYSLIFDQETTSPATIQQNLSNDQTFIEYFLGDSSLYTFTFTRDKTIFNKYDNPDSVKTWANEWVKTIPSMNQDFIVPAHQLYTALIEPMENLDVLSNNLIVVPDDVLNLINFEALVTALPSEERIYFPDFKDYMIFDHTISYAFSASTLKETQTTSHQSKKTYLGVAPTMNEGFYQQDHWFNKLDYNQEEVLQSASLFPQKNVIEKPSVKDDFLKLAPSYGLIHCATHAMANNKDGDLSFIALGQDESDIIYAKDLYALDLDADLVVLSACQTSAGELNRGEGIISLARSFTYAGAASVVTSLWNVREKANKEIIYDFYNLLKKGEPKDEALRSAKLNYLKNINRDNQMNAHPYFWATMVVIGDTSPIQTNLQWELIIPTALLLLIAAISYLKYQQRRTISQSS